jgi:glycosyltransferase involved in cell wall biosynthesis
MPLRWLPWRRDWGFPPLKLNGYARLVPRRDAQAMAKELQWIAAHPEEARAQALKGREYVMREWDRAKAFSDLARMFEEVLAERAS